MGKKKLEENWLKKIFYYNITLLWKWIFQREVFSPQFTIFLAKRVNQVTTCLRAICPKLLC